MPESTFKHEFSQFLTNFDEFKNTQVILRDFKESPSRPTPIDVYEKELVKYISTAILILNGKSSGPIDGNHQATLESTNCRENDLKLIPTILEKKGLFKKAFLVKL